MLWVLWVLWGAIGAMGAMGGVDGGARWGVFFLQPLWRRLVLACGGFWWWGCIKKLAVSFWDDAS